MSEREDLHVRLAELEEAVAETRAEVERIRVAPREDPKRLELRAQVKAERHAARVKKLQAELDAAENQLAGEREKLERAQNKLLAAERPPKRLSPGHYALIALAIVVALFAMCANHLPR